MLGILDGCEQDIVKYSVTNLSRRLLRTIPNEAENHICFLGTVSLFGWLYRTLHIQRAARYIEMFSSRLQVYGDSKQGLSGNKTACGC